MQQHCVEARRFVGQSHVAMSQTIYKHFAANITMEKKTNYDFASLKLICDRLVDQNAVREYKYKQLIQLFETYKHSTVMLGYFSQLRDYKTEHETLTGKVLKRRKELLLRCKEYLTCGNTTIFKQLLISPTNTEWYLQGINKYKKVKNCSTFHYRRKLYIALESEVIDLTNMKRLLEIVVAIDKFYDIYEDVINFFMRTSDRFEQLMRKHFTDYIQL